MNWVGCDICVYDYFWIVCVFPGGIPHSFRATGACPVTTHLINRVNVITTTRATTASSTKYQKKSGQTTGNYVVLGYYWGISPFDHLPKVIQ